MSIDISKLLIPLVVFAIVSLAYGKDSEIVYPERISHTLHKRDLSTKNKHGHVDHVKFRLKSSGESFDLDLKRNSDFHTPHILVKKYGKNNKEILKKHIPDSCYYHGKVINRENSYVLISTYDNKLRGVIEVDGRSLYLEPHHTHSHSNGAHILYTPSDDDEVFMKGKKSCAMHHNGTNQETVFHSRARRSLASLSAITNVEPQYIPYMTTTDTRYCEVYVVVDNEMYKKYDKNEALTIERVLNSFHSVDRAYSAINIRIVVVAIEIWTNGDKMTRTFDNSVTEYNSFKVYWKSNIRGKLSHDTAQFLSHKSWTDGIAGRAAIAGICSHGSAVGINAWSFNSVTGPTIVIGHEMGHNFNFPHDADMGNCVCLAGNRGCFMGGTKTRRPGFTDCNMRRLAAKSFSCLNNYPKGPFGQTCGNGIIESGEQCDCGTPEMCMKTDPCCQPGKCILKISAQCSDFNTPECCANCLMKKQGNLCRASTGACDVNEYCTGDSAMCPVDDNRVDGTTCSDTKILLHGAQKYRQIRLNFLNPKITARYIKITPHVNQVASSPCMTLEVHASKANEALAAVPTPISTRDLYYTNSLCVIPNITDCSDTTDARLIYKRMPHGVCNVPHGQFTLEIDGTLRHTCTNKVVCPDSKKHLYIKNSCDTPGDEKYERTAKRSLKNKNSGKCFLSDGGWPKTDRFIKFDYCDLDHDRTTLDFLIPDNVLPVGMEAGTFPSSSFSSNAEDTENKASEARLRTGKGFCFKLTDSPDAFLKIDLGETMTIGALEASAETGKSVTAFYVDYSLDNVHWQSYKESGGEQSASNSFCYKGKCVPTLTKQCKNLWDSGTTKADDKCWNKLNVEADNYGTCDPSAATACTTDNVFCGQIQCSSPKDAPLHLKYASSYSNILLEGSIKCSAANIINQENDEKGSGIGMVESGTKCGDSKICVNYKCVESTAANFVTCPKVDGLVCAGKGLCTNSGKCHCESGYDPLSNCKEELVARNGGVGLWSEWTLCSKGCEGGYRNRARFCDSPFPSHGGLDCTETLVEDVQCNPEACPSGSSCRSILQKAQSKGKQLHDGIYQVTLPDKTKMPVYCDMTRDGGGWTLVVSSHSATWTEESVYERNKDLPSLYKDYSIINHVDKMKDTYLISSSKMEYRLEAQELGKWGGIWKAPSVYKFKSTSSAQTDVKLIKKFSKWDDTDKNSALASRMPYISGIMITTSNSPTKDRQGSITDSLKGYATAKWMRGTLEVVKPESIWYWMREGAIDPPRSCRDVKLRGLQMNKLFPDGIYNIGTKTGELVQTYCDMTRYGGGWTLVLTSATTGIITADNIATYKTDSPSLTQDYSILGLADDIKKLDPAEDIFHYMIEADKNDGNGGIFSAAVSTKFIGSSEVVKPRILKLFAGLNADSNLARAVPRVDLTSGVLFGSTSNDASDTGGAIVKTTSSYIPGKLENPNFVRLWIREGVTRRSCNDIKIAGTHRSHSYQDGYYTIKDGKATVLPVYCDMTSDLGGWTLLVTSRHNQWTAEQVLSRNKGKPSLNDDYSILSLGDRFRDLSSGKTFKYKFAAKQMNRWGGIFTAPIEYSFVSNKPDFNKVVLEKQFDQWNYNIWYKTPCNRMPWLGNPDHKKGLLTTSSSDDYYWYGTIVSANDEFQPAPWINESGMKNPGVIWYFVNEDDCDASRTAVNGGLSHWSTWSTCSSLCGPGKRRQVRGCNSPKPKCGGNLCSEDERLVAEEECQGSCQASAITTNDDRYCLMPETGTCEFTKSTRLVWRSGLDQCQNAHAKFIFNFETGSIIHKCSNVPVCPSQGKTSSGTDIVIDPLCPASSPSHHFIRTNQNQVSFAEKCIHSNGGYPRDGVHIVLWSGCFTDRLRLKFYELPHGPVNAKYFYNIDVTVIEIDAALYKDIRYPNNPSSSGYLDGMQVPANVKSKYGVVINSYFIAPQSGSYVFKTACDNACDLYLGESVDVSTKKRIVRQKEHSGRNEFDKYPSQSSEPINLVAGNRYYIEAALIESGSSDHMTIAVKLPNGELINPITKHYLTDKSA